MNGPSLSFTDVIVAVKAVEIHELRLERNNYLGADMLTLYR
jgi:hypothetical protein